MQLVGERVGHKLQAVGMRIQEEHTMGSQRLAPHKPSDDTTHSA